MAQWGVAGKTFLITGGASGLGARYAEEFLKEGAKKVAIADIAEDTGKATAARLNSAYPGKVKFFKCDVSSEQQIADTFDRVVAEFQQLDVLINNAGIMSDNPAVCRKACDVNWQGLVSFTMRATRHMGKDEGGAGGTIINISSAAGFVKLKELPAYCGSKAAVIHFSTSLSEGDFFARTGIRVLTLCPGPTDTPLMQQLKSRAYKEEVGQRFAEEYDEIKKSDPPQTPEACIAACLKAYKEGAPGSVWMTVANKPAKNITPVIDKHYAEFFSLMLDQA